MKRCLLVCIVLMGILSACTAETDVLYSPSSVTAETSSVSGQTQQEPDSPVSSESGDLSSQKNPTSGLEQDLVSGRSLPYQLFLRAGVPVFEGAGYDCGYVKAVGQDGVYTITEESKDEEKNVWGKLKSGIGWIDLGYAYSIQNQPITACFAEDLPQEPENCLSYTAEDSEFLVRIAFQSNETLENVQLSALNPNGNSYSTEKVLYTFDTLSPDMTFVAGVVYYGDVTTYGISFTDGTGTVRCFAFYISGRNGSLQLVEYTS